MQARTGFWKLLTSEDNVRTDEPIEESVRDDILRNLSNVLNARRGRVYGHGDFGLDDMEDLGGSALRVADSIRKLILRFEPRIDPEGLRVSPTKSEGRLHIHDGYFRQSFVVEGKMLLPQGKVRPIQIRTTVVSDAAQIEGRVESVESDAAEMKSPRRVVVEPEVQS